MNWPWKDTHVQKTAGIIMYLATEKYSVWRHEKYSHRKDERERMQRSTNVGDGNHERVQASMHGNVAYV